jgi:hypothetical protein
MDINEDREICSNGGLWRWESCYEYMVTEINMDLQSFYI